MRDFLSTHSGFLFEAKRAKSHPPKAQVGLGQSPPLRLGSSRVRFLDSSCQNRLRLPRRSGHSNPHRSFDLLVS
jgi:hypothetical protein